MHDTADEHGHDGPLPEEEEDHPLWKLDTITLTSVGIDVGTATSQILFSRLVLRRLGQELSSRFVVTERKTLYLSPIQFTPYTANRERIDDAALGRLVDAAYQEAGLTPEDVNTGAIILTGEAIRRENARAIADLFATKRGDFVCATAGHNFEAMLAAHGSGAVALSVEKNCRVLNIDIGGGTTKLAAAENGRVLGTAALHIGGRLMATDAEGRITILEPGGDALARQVGFSWNIGDRVGTEQIEQLADHMARTVLSMAQDDHTGPEIQQLWVTPPLNTPKSYDAVVFSGGVGEYVYGQESESFGDLGAPLGRALKHHIHDGHLAWPDSPIQ
jgi:ethanolamine utilization protein EutA